MIVSMSLIWCILEMSLLGSKALFNQDMNCATAGDKSEPNEEIGGC